MTDKNGKVHVLDRADLRHRKKINVVAGNITPDKKHDRHAMQHFTTNEIKRLEEYMRENYPSDLPGGRLKRFHTHSDNAKQHFKSTGSMQYFTSLVSDGIGTAFVYSFGAPNHGKCWNDGIGGMLKMCITRECEASVTSGWLEYLQSGYILNAKDVWCTLIHFYANNNGAERDRQTSRQNGIGHYMFFYYDADHNPIHRTEETHQTLVGISDHYQFAVRRSGLLYMRMRPCWCLHCMRDFMEGKLEWGHLHQVNGCPQCVVASDTARAKEARVDGAGTNRSTSE